MDKDLKIYHEDSKNPPMTRDDVRNIILGELNNFRSYISAPWGGIGNSSPIFGGNLFGFFAGQGYGAYYKSPNQLQSTVSATTGKGTVANGNDYGRIFVETLPDTGEATPSWSFDLPQWSQKMLVKSTGPGVVYNTETVPFTEGAILTGATSGATATITAVFPDGTDGTLYLANIKGTFTDTENVTDSAGGAATLTRKTYSRTNPIMRLYGAGGEAADVPGSIFTFYGLVDLYSPLGLFNQSSSVNGTARDVEQIPAFENNGTLYVRNTAGTRAVRVYLNGAWQDFGASTVTTSASAHTVNTTTTSVLTYAHGLGTTPTTVRIQANVGGQFSDGTYDGTNQLGLAWGTNQAQAISGYMVFLTTSGGNIALGKITAVDATNVTISWADKSGTPSGTADLNIFAS